MFEENIFGTLMNMKKSNQTSMGFIVWFPFVRSHMKIIREGSLIAVRNFSSDNDVDHYSVMRITSVMPTHYAMMASMDGYPGFVEEAAMSASKDWNQDKPIEDTTKIICDAVPSRFEITRPHSMNIDEPKMVPETNLPMPGERVRLLNAEWTRRIINHDLQKQDGTINLGTLTNMKDVEILALWDSMIRTHFGVFAYTNAGKSNLLSTVISKIFSSKGSVKTVIYDLMGEYGILLADVLYNNKNACIIFLSQDTVPNSVSNFWRNATEKNASIAARDVVNTTVLPKTLTPEREMFVRPTQKMLIDGKFKILKPDSKTIRELLQDVINSVDDSVASRDLRTLLIKKSGNNCTVQNIEDLLTTLQTHEFEGKSYAKASVIKDKSISILEITKKKLSTIENIDQKYKITFNEIILDLNNKSNSSIYIIQDTNDIDVREFSNKFGGQILRHRREHGIISPPVSFIYDEADQFIAQDERNQQGMKESKQTAEQLARRGRKYGLGIGIATQRIVYLDTNILGQPHTYFVSKLPRASDREKIQEAFGLSDETLQESLRFNVGQWLLISHSATGVDGLPIPIQLPDANTRIKDFLNGLSKDAT